MGEKQSKKLHALAFFRCNKEQDKSSLLFGSSFQPKEASTLGAKKYGRDILTIGLEVVPFSSANIGDEAGLNTT
jgi:hypothetical protein